MVTQTIKTTYALDIETVRTLESLARRWNVSKSEAMRRAIRTSGSLPTPSREPEPLAALDQLQRVLHLKNDSAARWAAAIHSERKTGSQRRESRGK